VLSRFSRNENEAGLLSGAVGQQVVGEVQFTGEQLITCSGGDHQVVDGKQVVALVPGSLRR
jgi:hypothetical protein